MNKSIVNSNLVLSNVDSDAKKLVDERDPVYGNTWQKMRVEHVIFEIVQKVERIQNMPDGPAKYEQAVDVVNYSRFLAWHLKPQAK